MAYQVMAGYNFSVSLSPEGDAFTPYVPIADEFAPYIPVDELPDGYVEHAAICCTDIFKTPLEDCGIHINKCIFCPECREMYSIRVLP